MSDERSTRLSSVLGASAVVLGNVHGQGDIEIRGRVQGNVVVDGRVVVARGGKILGAIEAIHVTISGAVRGDVSASDGVTIGASGEVEGNLNAPRVGIEAGARVRGHLRTGVPSEATKPSPKIVETPSVDASSDYASNEEASSEEAASDGADGSDVVGAEDASVRAHGEPRRKRRRRRGKGPRPSERADDSERKLSPDALPRNVGSTLGVAVLAEAALRPRPPEPPERRRRETPHLAPPAVPTFRKGSHGHRRDD